MSPFPFALLRLCHLAEHCLQSEILTKDQMQHQGCRDPPIVEQDLSYMPLLWSLKVMRQTMGDWFQSKVWSSAKYIKFPTVSVRIHFTCYTSSITPCWTSAVSVHILMHATLLSILHAGNLFCMLLKPLLQVHALLQFKPVTLEAVTLLHTQGFYSKCTN